MKQGTVSQQPLRKVKGRFIANTEGRGSKWLRRLRFLLPPWIAIRFPGPRKKRCQRISDGISLPQAWTNKDIERFAREVRVRQWGGQVVSSPFKNLCAFVDIIFDCSRHCALSTCKGSRSFLHSFNLYFIVYSVSLSNWNNVCATLIWLRVSTDDWQPKLIDAKSLRLFPRTRNMVIIRRLSTRNFNIPQVRVL